MEEQQASQQGTASESSTGGRASVVAMKGNLAADAERKRRRQGLELQRERILSERTANAHRRSALSAALLEIEEQLTELGWTVHL